MAKHTVVMEPAVQKPAFHIVHAKLLLRW